MLCNVVLRFCSNPPHQKTAMVQNSEVGDSNLLSKGPPAPTSVGDRFGEGGGEGGTCWDSLTFINITQVSVRCAALKNAMSF